MRGAVEHASEGEGGNGVRVVASLDDGREALLAQAVEIGLGEDRTLHDVGHQRQCICQARHWCVQANR